MAWNFAECTPVWAILALDYGAGRKFAEIPIQYLILIALHPRNREQSRFRAVTTKKGASRTQGLSRCGSLWRHSSDAGASSSGKSAPIGQFH